jgi:predicted transposase YbfD/YdcC
VRRSHDAGHDLGPLHLVSVWATEQNLTLAQVATDVKSNEITAIPRVLELVDIKGATITIDAMGCQKAIAKQIVDSGGNYILAVKGNQPTLEQDIESFFHEQLENDFFDVRFRHTKTRNTEQGTRTCGDAGVLPGGGSGVVFQNA